MFSVVPAGRAGKREQRLHSQKRGRPKAAPFIDQEKKQRNQELVEAATRAGQVVGHATARADALVEQARPTGKAFGPGGVLIVAADAAIHRLEDRTVVATRNGGRAAGHV